MTYYQGPVGINPFTRARAEDVAVNLQAIADTFATFPPVDQLGFAPATDVDYLGTPLSVKLGETVSATEFRFAGGARGNGIANDSPAIQAAIDYVAARGGGTVRLPRPSVRYALGMRFIAAPYFGFFGLELKTGVCLEGDDEYGSYMRIMDNIPGVGPGAPFVAILGQSNMQNVSVRNLTIDGNRQAQPGLDPTNPNNQPPSNGGTVLIGNYDSTPIYNVHIERVRSLNAFGQGIQVFGQNSSLARNVRIDRCDVIGPGYIGIQVSRCDGANITDNYIENSGDNAIDVYGDSNATESVALNIIIRGNRMKGCLRGIFPETTMFVLVEGNTIDGSDEGIHCNQIVSAPHSMIIQGNTIRRTRAPMVFSGSFNCVLVIANIITEFTYAAFTIGFTSGQCAGVVFDRNMVWPTDNTVPIFYVPPGTVFLSAIKFGTTYLTERDSAHPTPTNLYLSGQAQYQSLSSYPAVMSVTNPGRDKPEAYLDYPVLNKAKFQGVSAASNAAAISAGAVTSEFYYNTTLGALSVVQ
jgi:hypothetical protein